jgi:hypothetical protein
MAHAYQDGTIGIMELRIYAYHPGDPCMPSETVEA